MHGGTAPRGIASPSWKHGRYSRALPRDLADAYRRAASDPKLLEMRSEIALVDARLAQLLARLGSGESAAGWQALSDLAARLAAAHANGDGAEVGATAEAMSEILGGRLGDRSTWVEIAALLDLRRRLVEGEARRVERLGLYLTAEEAAALAGGILAALRQEVADPRVLSNIASRIESLLAEGRSELN